MTTTPAASPSAATPIYTFADILAAMEHNPELRSAMRQHILDLEFQQLPAEMQELRQIVAELRQTLRDFIAAANARFDRLEAGQEELRSGQEELRSGQAELREGQAELREGQAQHTARLERLEAGQEELRSDVAELKAGQEELRAGQEELREGQAQHTARLDRLESGQRSMQGDLNRLKGRDYERRVTRLAMSLAAHYLGAPDPQVVWSETHQDNTELSRLLRAAARAGRITVDEAMMVENADIVLADGAGGYCLAEVSITLDDSDIIRARRRADLLAQAVNAPAQAFVIGTQILDTSRDAAAAHQVAVCILPD